MPVLKRICVLSLLIIILALTVAPALQAQGIGGSISGRVVDQQNLAVAGASVRILNKATNQARIVSTDGQGGYEARELPPGLYDVIVEQAGFKPVRLENVRLSVASTAKLQLATLEPVPLEATVEVRAVSAEVSLTDTTSPTLSTSFSDKQIRELPILSRDLNNLALLAPGVFSVRAFSFASTLVPFSANGSRGRDNNFIIDSVDNNEPIFGGAATQFTNTDLFAEYRILTNQYKAEYGRNSGSVVNIITERGGNAWHGSAFWYGQHDNFNARSAVERTAGLDSTSLFYENQLGFTVGGPFRKDKTWFFASYQWDRARQDLSGIFPLVATLPQTAGLTLLAPFSGQLTVRSLLANPTVASLPGQVSACGQTGSGLPTNNPCTIGGASVFNRAAPATAATNCFVFPLPAGCTLAATIPFGTFLVPRAGLFDVRDHQASFRVDHQLTNRDDVYVRYLFDDLKTPRTAGAFPAEIAFLDLGLLPEYRIINRQRTQSMGVFWTHAWPTALHELRLSGTRIATRSGAFGVDEQTIETVPAYTVVDDFALSTAPGGTVAGRDSLISYFTAAGQNFTLGRDSRPTKIASNLFQLQDNLSLSTGKHAIKVGANFVVTDSNIRQATGDLGQYIYSTGQRRGGFDAFVNNRPIAAFRRFTNFGGRGGDVLPLREFAQFYFLQDDIQLRPNFTLSVGIRYENYGQVINRLSEINPAFGAPVKTDNNNFAPRLGIAWSPWDGFVFRGGYGFYYNPTPFIVPLVAWQSGPISPLVSVFNPSAVFPALPVNPLTLGQTFANCDFLVPGGSATPVSCSAQDAISKNLTAPYAQNYSLSMQWQFYRDGLFEIAYVGSKGTGLFQRVDRNPQLGYTVLTVAGPTCGTPPCVVDNQRTTATRGSITEINNGAHATYNALQFIGTKRISRKYDVAITAAYTWSHMLDNASEIFGPGVRELNIFSGGGGDKEVEAITPFAQDYRNTTSAERGNSAFDRRHRLAISYLWNIPSPESGRAKWAIGGWQLNGFVTIQSGQPFTPVNGRSNGSCRDAFGDGFPTNDRPDIGSSGAAINSVARINNQLCIDPRDFSSLPLVTVAAIRATNQIGGVTGPDYVDINGNATAASVNRFVQVGLNRIGNAGRNILIGPRLTNFDMAVLKNFPWGERWNLQFRAEAYNIMNSRNPGNPIGNVFSSTAQPVPGIAFIPVTPTPARVIGTIPENAIDSLDQVTGVGQFLSQRFMNTSSRHFQFALKLQF